MKGDCDRFRERLDELEFLGSFRPKAVIDCNTREADLQGFSKVRQDVKERHRIGTTAHRDENVLARPDAALIE